MSHKTAEKDPDNIEPYYLVWCSKDTGLNDGSDDDVGELQGATILTAAWTVTPAGLTIDSSNQGSVSIQGILYAINTVATVWVSGGVAGVDYTLNCRITTSNARTLDDSIIIPVRQN